MSTNDPNNPGQWQPQNWEPREWNSSLGDSSLDDAQPYASSSNAPAGPPAGSGTSPNPFSREGSGPGDELGSGYQGPPASSAGSATPPASSDSAPAFPASSGSAAQPDGANAWPAYPANEPAPQDPQPGYGNNGSYGSPQGYGGNPTDYPQAQPYPQANSYGSAPDPYPQTQPYPSGQQQPYPDAGAGNYDTGSQYGANPYDVNPYQGAYGMGSPYGVPAVNHPQATTAMVLGIVGLVVCPFVGIAGLVMGNKARKEIDANPQQYTGRGMATAGFVLGILATVYSVFALIYVVVIIGIGASGGFE